MSDLKNTIDRSGLYNSSEWKDLDKIYRAQLLLVIEDLKRSTIIYGNWTSLMDIIRNTGLEYELNTSKYALNPVVVVARPKDFQEYHRMLLSLPEGANGSDFHKIDGWLFSYPDCCISEYIKKRTPQQHAAKRNRQHHMSFQFGQELDAIIKISRSYPEVFDYRPPSFTPCGVNCPLAISILTSWKDALISLDPEAGEELVYFNRNNFPERLVHKEYLSQERNRRGLEYKLKILRSSLK